MTLYPSITLREPTGSGYVPRGPRFASALPVRFSVEDTRIEFRAPRHQPESRVTRAVQPARRMRLDDHVYQREYREGAHLADSWGYAEIFYRCWAFNGPWFTGPLAELCMSLNLFRLNEPRPGVSWYHPRAFEQAVADYLTNRYALKKQDGRSVWIAPARWRPLPDLPVAGAHVHVHPDEAVTLLRIPRDYVFFPVADQVLGIMIFYPRRLRGRGSEAEWEKFISKAPLLELMDGIIGSLRMELSPAARERRDQALQGLADTRLTEHFPPLKWTTAEEDALWASKHPDIPPLDPSRLKF